MTAAKGRLLRLEYLLSPGQYAVLLGFRVLETNLKPEDAMAQCIVSSKASLAALLLGLLLELGIISMTTSLGRPMA